MAAAVQSQQSTITEPASGRRFGHGHSTETHEERGLGWRARWEEGAETLELEKEPDPADR